MKPSIPKGTRDFSPVEMLRRKYIFSTIEKVFQRYGFLPLETPAMENLETLTGKYGEEGDRLIFKILKRGQSFEAAIDDALASSPLLGEILSEIASPSRQLSESVLDDLKKHLYKSFNRGGADMALRYDLTVPFARYVVQHQNELAFPFKRYQIQPVWRADRPQKGRYREFYQCDADVIGSNSELNELDLVCIIHEVFQCFDLEVLVMMNSRKLLRGLAQLFCVQDKFIDFVTTLDKYDKIGAGIVYEYEAKGYSGESLKRIKEFLDPPNLVHQTPVGVRLSEMFRQHGIEEGLDAYMELMEFQAKVEQLLGLEFSARFKIDFRLARGIDYYTGAIFEVKALEGTLQSSICGGGRYDDLTGVFGLKGMSGVGISFGADRIYDVLLETNKFPAELGASTKLLFTNFGEAEAMHCLKLLRQVREARIAAELYPDAVKMAKQFKYADDKGIPYVAIIGENEMKQGIVTIKDMKSGEQKAVKQDELMTLLKGLA